MNSEEKIQPFENISLSKAQIREFLNRLAGNEGCQYNGFEWRCGGHEFIYARKILTLMHISESEQNKLIEICKEKGDIATVKFL